MSQYFRELLWTPLKAISNLCSPPSSTAIARPRHRSQVIDRSHCPVSLRRHQPHALRSACVCSFSLSVLYISSFVQLAIPTSIAATLNFLRTRQVRRRTAQAEHETAPAVSCFLSLKLYPTFLDHSLLTSFQNFRPLGGACVRLVVLATLSAQPVWKEAMESVEHRMNVACGGKRFYSVFYGEY